MLAVQRRSKSVTAIVCHILVCRLNLVCLCTCSSPSLPSSHPSTRYEKDRAILEEFMERDTVSDNGVCLRPEIMALPQEKNGPIIERPVVRIPRQGIVLTRIHPDVSEES